MAKALVAPETTESKPDYRETLLSGMDEPETEPTEPQPADTTPLPDPVEPDPVAEPDEPPRSEFVSQLAEMGFSDIDSDDTGRARLLSAYSKSNEELESLRREQAELRQMAQYGNQYLAQMQQPSNRAPAPATPEDSKPEPWWSPPKFDATWVERYREFDPATNQHVWKKDTPAEVVSGAHAYQAYIDDWTHNLSVRPNEVLPKVIEGILRENPELIRAVAQPAFEDFYGERRRTESHTEFVERLKREQADWLYEKDPRTNTPLIGQLSRDGEQMMQYVSQADKMGITDPTQQWDYADKMRRLNQYEAGATTETASQTAREVAADKRLQHQRRGQAATSIPSRGGSIVRPDSAQEPRPQNRNESRGRQLLHQMEEDGVGTL